MYAALCKVRLRGMRGSSENRKDKLRATHPRTQHWSTKGETEEGGNRIKPDH